MKKDRLNAENKDSILAETKMSQTMKISVIHVRLNEFEYLQRNNVEFMIAFSLSELIASYECRSRYVCMSEQLTFSWYWATWIVAWTGLRSEFRDRDNTRESIIELAELISLFDRKKRVEFANPTDRLI